VVVAIVDGCTDADTIPKKEWGERKRAYVAHIADASASVRLVSTADKLTQRPRHSRRLPRDGDTLWSRFNADSLDILWYYRALADAFERAGSTPLGRQLDKTVSDLEALTAFQRSTRLRISLPLITYCPRGGIVTDGPINARRSHDDARLETRLLGGGNTRGARPIDGWAGGSVGWV
jgi:hypothetical protein